MWLINGWDFQNIDTKIFILYTVLEEEIYMKIPQGMAEIFE